MTNDLATTMDPADKDTVRSALSAQEKMLHQHETQLSAICGGVKELKECQEELQSALATQVKLLTVQLQFVIIHLEEIASPQPATPESEQPSTPLVQPPIMLRPVCLAPPENYSGKSGECRSFLVQCDLHFKNGPAAFNSDQVQVAFMVSHLRGRAAAWATVEWARECSSLPRCQVVFTDSFQDV
ncbi:hypothetical protein L3Q82_003242 [Scortum barcoo]|uniref:Uncharacterized protein n=1 Tax=Scortum barcoo TaxID=214431 RepID=A0ACB8VS35_9TELE|nr:hypothetical protein L3Q82_003242 [Scortum barcoo]